MASGSSAEWVVRIFGEEWRLWVVNDGEEVPAPSRADLVASDSPIDAILYAGSDRVGEGGADVAEVLLRVRDALHDDAQLRTMDDAVYDALQSGRLRFERVAPPPWPFADEQDERPVLGPQPVVAEETTWIGIELVDDDGNPVGGRPYRIQLPDGSVREGRLDGAGVATIAGIDGGTCQIECPFSPAIETTTHVVEQGEHAPGIAERHGYEDFRDIWNHPKNAKLRERRRSPTILSPGDELHIPARAPVRARRATGARHRFVVNVAPLRLRVTFLDFLGRPLANAPITLSGRAPADLVTDASGLVETAISPGDRDHDLAVASLSLPVQVGFLDPIDEQTGWKARLLNLGYPLDPSDDGDDDDVRLALEEFQADQGLPVTGQLDTATRDTLEQVYGC